MMVKKKETNCMLTAEREHCFVLFWVFFVVFFAFVFHTCFLRGIELTVLPKLDK